MTRNTTYEEIVRSIKNKDYKPIYLLMGDEPYYIDKIADYIADIVLDENEKEFNQTVLYGNDIDVATIINSAKRYPMMAERQVVIIKEFQNVKNSEELMYYVQKPLDSTILVLCYKNGSLDKRKKLYAEIQKNGIIFESKKINDEQVIGFIKAYLKRKSVEIEEKAAELLSEYVGSDLNRLSGELEKLIIVLPKESRRITSALIEKNIGISKDYNNFELLNALVNKDILKANKIVKYFADNTKANPLQKTLPVIFNYFANLMVAYYAPDKSGRGVAIFLGLKGEWFAKDYIIGMKNYTGVKVMSIINDIRYCDAKSKGIENVTTSSPDLLRELVYKILH